MTQHVARRLSSLALALSAAGLASMSLASAQAAPTAGTGATTAMRPTQDTSSALVQLAGDPLSVAEKTKPAKGQKIDFNNGVTKSVRAQLSALRNDYKAWLRNNVPQALQ